MCLPFIYMESANMVDIQPVSITSTNTYNNKETLKNIKSQDKSNIPTRYEEITSAWVLMVVNQYRIRKGSEPFSNNTQIKSLKGVSLKHNAGELSSIYRLNVQFLDSSYQFVAKFLPSDDISIVEACHKNVFEKEISIYFDLLPAIKCSVSESIATLIPEVIYASHNENGAGAIVFKSCEMDGYSMIQDPNGLRPMHLRIAIKSLAQFHAYGSKFIDDATLEAVKERYEFLDQKQMESNQFFPKESGDEGLEPLFREALSIPVSYDLNPKFLTIIHGEYWEPNVMFDKLMGIKILDWKHARLDSCVFDLAFLLGSHVLSQEEINEYIQDYFDAYAETCQSLDHSFQFTMDDLVKEYADMYKNRVARSVAHALKKEMVYLSSGKAPSRRDAFRKRVGTLLAGMKH